MKRLLPLLLLTALCVGLTACGQQGQGTDQKKKDDPASLYNESANQTVSLGMSPDQISAVLGQGTRQDGLANADANNGDYIYGADENALSVTYQDGRVVTLSSATGNSTASTRWATVGGITVGSTKDALTKQFGDQSPTLTNWTMSDGTIADLYVFHTSASDGSAPEMDFLVDSSQGTVLTLQVTLRPTVSTGETTS